MAKELQPIDISNLPEVLHLAEEVERRQAPRRLKRGDQDVAILAPVEKAPSGKKPTRRRDGRTGPDDPVWKLIGLVHSEGPGDVSENKYKYLAGCL
ncbi:MAG TPA: hypothetical protein VEQ11_21970 [Chloroflexota bacterium]|nr:hypothetical protein [Chloroflexota bacterium]